MANNILYEADDVEIMLIGTEGMDEFLAEAQNKVKKAGGKQNKRKDSSQIYLADFDEDEDYNRMYDLYCLGGNRWRA